LNEIATRKNVLQSDDDLKAPDSVFRPGSSLQGVGTPMMRPAPAPGVSSKRLKELLEKREQWPFLEAEDYQSTPTLEEIFGIPEYGPNGEVKEKASPLERYYERMDRPATTRTNRMDNDDFTAMDLLHGRRTDGINQDLNIPGAANKPGASSPESENPLTQLLRGNPGNSLFPERANPSGPWGTPGQFGQFGQWNAESPEALRAQEMRLEEYKRILDYQMPSSLPSSSPVSGIAPFDPFKPSPSTTPAFALPKAPDPLPTTPARDWSSALPTVGAVGRPFELPEVPTSVPGVSPATPLPEPVRAAVPAPDFNIPKRRF
jgi:hypothetical protein